MENAARWRNGFVRSSWSKSVESSNGLGSASCICYPQSDITQLLNDQVQEVAGSQRNLKQEIELVNVSVDRRAGP